MEPKSMTTNYNEIMKLAILLQTSEPIIQAIIERVGSRFSAILAEWQEPLNEAAILARATQIANKNHPYRKTRLVWSTGNDIAPPKGAIGYKYECPYEEEQWIFSEAFLREVEIYDPSLVIRFDTEAA